MRIYRRIRKRCDRRRVLPIPYRRAKRSRKSVPRVRLCNTICRPVWQEYGRYHAIHTQNGAKTGQLVSPSGMKIAQLGQQWVENH